MNDDLDLRDLYLCFEGAVPAVIATASANEVPNITYLSRVRMVDGERVALSNQFFSKTARTSRRTRRASVLVVDPCTYDQYRVTLIYERTERRGRRSSGCAMTSTPSRHYTACKTYSTYVPPTSTEW